MPCRVGGQGGANAAVGVRTYGGQTEGKKRVRVADSRDSACPLRWHWADAVEEMGGFAVGPAATLREPHSKRATGTTPLTDIWLGDTSGLIYWRHTWPTGIHSFVVRGAPSPDQPLSYQRRVVAKPVSARKYELHYRSVLPIKSTTTIRFDSPAFSSDYRRPPRFLASGQ